MVGHSFKLIDRIRIISYWGKYDNWMKSIRRLKTVLFEWLFFHTLPKNWTLRIICLLKPWMTHRLVHHYTLRCRQLGGISSSWRQKRCGWVAHYSVFRGQECANKIWSDAFLEQEFFPVNWSRGRGRTGLPPSKAQNWYEQNHAESWKSPFQASGMVFAVRQVHISSHIGILK